MSKNVEAIYPLSPMQEGMLFHTLLEPGSGMYCEQLCCSLQGEINTEALKQSWQAVINRHSVLRTAFVWERMKKPLQVVRQQVEVTWKERDWRQLSDEERRQSIHCLLAEDRKRGFEMACAPLLRFELCRWTDDTYQFVWSHHHILLDGWCLSLILKDVFTFYEGLSRGKEVLLPPAPPYQNYIDWLYKQDLSIAQDFWSRRLKGFKRPTPLGFEHSRRLAAGDVAEESKWFSENFTRELQHFARNHQLTLNTLIQGAWSLLLSRYSDEEDIVFGATVSGRPADLPDVESIVGLFINTLPVRVAVHPESAVLFWLQELQHQQVEARQYDYAPLVEIQKWSELPPGTPLFESILVFENYPVDESVQAKTESLRVSNVRIAERTNYSFTIAVGVGTSIGLNTKYHTDRLEACVVRRLLSQLEFVLAQIVRGPLQKLGTLTLMERDEREYIIREWNQTATRNEASTNVCELFEAQAEQNPHVIAVEFEDWGVTYCELNDRANRLAHYLKTFGVGPEVCVGICADKTIEMIVGMLGVLKAGGAYVPLDPSAPLERIDYMIRDSEAMVLLVQRKTEDKLPARAGIVLYLDNMQEELASFSKCNPQIAIDSSNLAYVIYTSGSTGVPKGVLLEHGGLVNLVKAQNEGFEIGPGSKVLQFASMSFDASVSEIFTALTAGATLSLWPREKLFPGPDLLGVLEEAGVSVVTLPPSAFAVMDLRDLSQLKTVVSAGEACGAENVEKWGKGRRFLNAYGPTEGTVCATMEVCEANGDKPTIGRPIRNAQVYLLDGNLEPVPIGVRGELYIGGAGVARGYLHRADLTAENFVPDPFGDEGNRLYRTGDWGRYQSDGRIEFLGRKDHQLKVRGHRVELGEIEAVLGRCPQVQEQVVVARDDQNGHKQLVAYVVLNTSVAVQGDSSVSSENTPQPAHGLRDQLRTQLPEYFVPSQFVFLKSLPKTASGKVDRQALPHSGEGQEGFEGVGTFEARTPVEEVLSGLWRQLLNLNRVGLREDFFELGGHSLLATQLVSRVRDAFGVELTLQDFFNAPTIADLATKIEATRRSAENLPVPPIMPVPRDQVLPLSFSQERLWLVEQMTPGNTSYNSVSTVRLKGRLHISAFQRALQELTRRHEVLRTTFAIKDGKPFQVIHEALNIPLRMVDFGDNTEEEQKVELNRLIQVCAKEPFDLVAGPLVRMILCRLSDQSYVFFYTLHHIIFDGWSKAILNRELGLLYDAFLDEQPSPLPELPVQYADFSIWQRQWLQGEVLEKQLMYWREKLKGISPLELPFDRPRPKVKKYEGRTVPLSVSQRILEELRKLSREEGVTLFMTLLAVFKTLLHRYTGQDDVAVGSPIANRNRAETENLVGFFANSQVLRTDLSGDPTFRMLLKRVRETTLGAYTHQDVPFEKVVEDLRPERHLGRSNPLIEVVFALQDAPVDSVRLKGLELSTMSWDGVKAPAVDDLQLFFLETPSGMVGTLVYNVDLFEDSTVHRMAQHLNSLLEGIAANPEQCLSEIPMLTGEEQEQLLDWNHV